jgi:hypothetical protein
VDFLPLSQGVGYKIRAGDSGFTATCSVTSSAHVAQSVEHILGKDEVTGSNPVMGLPGSGEGGTAKEKGEKIRGSVGEERI